MLYRTIKQFEEEHQKAFLQLYEQGCERIKKESEEKDNIIKNQQWVIDNLRDALLKRGVKPFELDWLSTGFDSTIEEEK